jgi:formylglycine-generating enzyme required for sulfatase activity
MSPSRRPGLLALLLGLAPLGAQTTGLPPLESRAVAIQAAPGADGIQRVALVIGNGAYPTEMALRNPVNDARAMRTALLACRFQVTLLENGTRRGMVEAIQAYGNALRGGAIGLFYYAGHGLQVRGANYLVPVDARLSSEADAEFETVEVNRLLAQMEEARNPLNILVLDACRNNPFTRSWRRSVDQGQGLAMMNAPGGTFIAYATSPGSTAADGQGENSPYTQALIQALGEPGLSIEQTFKNVNQRVGLATGNAQTPWISSSLRGDFYFRPLLKPLSGPTAAELEATVWAGVKDTARAQELEDFLARYPGGSYAELALAKLTNLRKVAPPVRVSSPIEPGKALRKDRLETPEEFARRVAALGSIQVGTALVSGDNYDLEKRRLTLPLRAEVWARPYVTRSRMELELDRAQVQRLAAAGGSTPLAATFEVRDNRLRTASLILSTAIGAFPVPEEAPPAPGAAPNPFGLWEATLPAGNVRFTMVRIPAGSFRMGSKAGKEHEQPIHDVTISRDFWIGKFPVTQAQYQAVTGSNPSDFRKAGPEAPVDQVNWDDTQAYIARLNDQQTAFTFRLPTEAEWEYACRAGSEGETYGPLEAIAWFAGNSGQTTHPVGQKLPNDFGLHDMLGNVWQWCQDAYSPTYYATSPATDPQGLPGATWGRVLRGGSWGEDATKCRAATRGRFGANGMLTRYFQYGFRLVAVARTP